MPVALIATALVLVAGGIRPRAQQAATPTFRGGINFVRVDAIVTDKQGRPVTDLRQSDFDVLEAGTPQTIEQFRLVKSDGRPAAGEPPPREILGRDDEEAQAARDDVRVVVIFLDDYHVRRENAIQIRDRLARFVQTQIGPNDLAAVMYPLTPIGEVSFTRNMDAVTKRIAAFEGRKYDYTARNDIEREYIDGQRSRYTAQQVEGIRNDVVMDALRGLSVRLGSVRDGRKSVLFVSEGFTGLLPTAFNRHNAAVPDVPCFAPGQTECNPALGPDGRNRDPEFDDKLPNRLTAEAFEDSDVSARLKDVVTAANRNNVSVYTLDPRRLALSEYTTEENIGSAQDRRALRTTQDELRSLAEETDGRAIVGRNTVDSALAQMMQDSSVYYLLGYTSKQSADDGKFHEIAVRVKRPGVNVRARKGYWAASVSDVTKAAHPSPPAVSKPVEEALAAISPVVSAARSVRTWIGTERGANGRTHVTVAWEPAERAAGGAGRGEAVGALSLLALGPGGDAVYRGRSDMPASTARAAAAAAPQHIAFDAPPGRLELKMTVEASGGGTLDTDERTIDVPDFTAPQVALSTPRLSRTRTARDFDAVALDANAVPAVAREFSRAERLLIRFDVYAPGNPPPAPTAALLNRDGKMMASLPVSPAKAGGTHQIDLGLNTLAAGEYLVEITVTDGSGTAETLVPFRVAG